MNNSYSAPRISCFLSQFIFVRIVFWKITADEMELAHTAGVSVLTACWCRLALNLHIMNHFSHISSYDILASCGVYMVQCYFFLVPYRPIPYCHPVYCSVQPKPQKGSNSLHHSALLAPAVPRVPPWGPLSSTVPMRCPSASSNQLRAPRCPASTRSAPKC